jgi:hypothetical protein
VKIVEPISVVVPPITQMGRPGMGIPGIHPGGEDGVMVVAVPPHETAVSPTENEVPDAGTQLTLAIVPVITPMPVGAVKVTVPLAALGPTTFVTSGVTAGVHVIWLA